MHFYQNWEQEMSFTISQATEIDMEFCEQFEILSDSNFKKNATDVNFSENRPGVEVFLKLSPAENHRDARNYHNNKAPERKLVPVCLRT